jgi:hypothetical protein
MVHICKLEDGEILDSDERLVEYLIRFQEGRKDKSYFQEGKGI